MSRKEEIIDAGVDYTMSTRPVCIGGVAFEDMVRDFNRNPSFEQGAMWADRTMLDKVCKWLKENIDEDVLVKCGSVIKCMDADEFSEYFRKAMEE